MLHSKLKQISIFIVVLFLFGEAAFRIYDYAVTGKNTKLDSLTESADGGHTNRLNPGFDNGMYKVNSMGFRGDEFSLEKKGDIYRIVGIGDSCMFGLGISEKEKTLCEWLEEKLNGQRLGIRYEVINAGVPGYKSNQCLKYLKDELLGLAPDMVVIYTGWNDMWIAKFAAAAIAERKREKHKALCSVSKMFFWLETAMNGYFHESRRRNIWKYNYGELSGYVYGQYRKNITVILELCQEKGIKAVVMTRPSTLRNTDSNEDKIRIMGNLSREKGGKVYSYGMDYGGLFEFHKEMNRIVREVSLSRSAHVVDAEKLFENMPLEVTLSCFQEFIHMNEKGASQTAEFVCRKIREMR